MLHTLYNLNPAAEPNLTVLWSADAAGELEALHARRFPATPTPSSTKTTTSCARIYGDDYAIACCVSAMKVGKEMQFFGARANLAKLLLLALNGGRGRDEEHAGRPGA